MVRAVIRAEEQWWEFTDPIEILCAHSLEEVEPQLRRAAAAGYYAVGYVAYEAAAAFDSALCTHPQGEWPLLYFALFKTPKKYDQLPPCERTEWQVEGLCPRHSETDFLDDIAKIKAQIAQGATYQVNYTYPLEGRFKGDAYALFTTLMEAQDAPYAAYIQTEAWSIISVSLELFFRLEGDRLISRPMKGTAARGPNDAEDRQQAEALQASEKNRAENIMIVDMIRNDMGRIAQAGSVKTTQTYALERYASLWQMTSTIQSRVVGGVEAVFRALFPCASITGAPKVKTMEIITQLERAPRSVYTGSVGYITPKGDATFNVAIRTALIDHRRDTITYGVGSGIVWDSDPLLEYAETQMKATLLTTPTPSFAILESVRWSPEEGMSLANLHLDRMARSASYFDYPFDRAQARALLAQVEGEQALKVRLLLERSGRLHVASAPLEPLSDRAVLEVKLARDPVDPADRFLYHKTTHRQVYAAAEAERNPCDEVILWNSAGEITEGTIFNVAIADQGSWITPPLSCGLLGGVARELALREGTLKEAVISRGMFENAAHIKLFNSVRGWYDAVLI